MLQAENDAQQQHVRKLLPVTVFVLAESLDEVVGKPAPNRGESWAYLSIFIRCCYGVFPRLCRPSASHNEAPYRHVEQQTSICVRSRPERALGDSGVLPLVLAEPEAAENKSAVGHRALQKCCNLFVYASFVGLKHKLYLKSH